MKIVILSDLHANLEALRAIEESWDKLICLGDLVDYGISPHEIIRFVRENADAVVRGNHDQALANGVDCGCAPPFHALSVATRELMKQVVLHEEMDFLRSIPETHTLNISGVRFYLCHAAPSNHFYEYLDKDSKMEVWKKEAALVDADFILLGHTHQQFVKDTGSMTFINPGSVGLSRDLPGRACYATWNDGNIELKNLRYDVDQCVERLAASPLPENIKEQLEGVIRGVL
jgi:putative phosphoesterase